MFYAFAPTGSISNGSIIDFSMDILLLFRLKNYIVIILCFIINPLFLKVMWRLSTIDCAKRASFLYHLNESIYFITY